MIETILWPVVIRFFLRADVLENKAEYLVA